MNTSPHSERLAQQFHEVYERLAPEYAYETREESQVAWIDVPPKNRDLMIATVEEVMGGFFEQLETAREAVQACYDDLQRYAPPHWRNQGKGEILARNFLTSNPATKP